MAQVLIVGKSGYGDMFPMFAIAQALKSKGHVVSIAAEGHHQHAATYLDVPLIKLDASGSADKAGASRAAFPGLRGMSEIFRTLSPYSLEAEYETLLAVADDYDLIVGNQVAFAGSLVSRKLKKPWVYCAPSPLAIPSWNDPPLFPYIHRLQTHSMDSPQTQRPYIALARGVSRLMMSSIVRLEKRLGIWSGRHPRFEGMYSDRLNLLLTSPLLLTPQPDWPENTVLTGFTWFEPGFMRSEEKLLALARFVAAGSPPVVFALGGSKRTRPGKFFTESIKACKLLGIRAILVAADRFHAELPRSPDILVTGYLPYSELLGNASALVHSGGIGAIGWSLRFGIPSLLVPSEWDQYDNAHRAFRQKLATVMNQEDYTAAKIASHLEKLLGDKERLQLLQSYSERLREEDGAAVACARIESVLEEISSRK